MVLACLNFFRRDRSGAIMKRFIEGEARTQVTLLPECLDDYVAEENSVRVVDVFVDELDLGALGFGGVDPAATGRPAYHPAVLLKIYIYGYLNRIQSSRRLEREAERNVELMWLTGRLAPDFKTIGWVWVFSRLTHCYQGNRPLLVCYTGLFCLMGLLWRRGGG
ncbi:hypothetical protein PS907_00596 [Pseudomonas fluorescens]|nr:hypothetical protein PS907_00596 [Pseudomonas fluorescens]